MRRTTAVTLAATAAALGYLTGQHQERAAAAQARAVITPGPVWVESNGRSVGVLATVTTRPRPTRCRRVTVRVVVTPGYRRFRPRPVLARRVYRPVLCPRRAAGVVDVFDIRRPGLTPGRVWVTIRAGRQSRRVRATIPSF